MHSVGIAASDSCALQMLFLIIQSFIFRRLAGTLALMSAIPVSVQLSQLNASHLGTSSLAKTPIARICTLFRCVAVLRADLSSAFIGFFCVFLDRVDSSCFYLTSVSAVPSQALAVSRVASTRFNHRCCF
jgi:hypothetical protein